MTTIAADANAMSAGDSKATTTADAAVAAVVRKVRAEAVAVTTAVGLAIRVGIPRRRAWVGDIGVNDDLGPGRRFSRRLGSRHGGKNPPNSGRLRQGFSALSR